MGRGVLHTFVETMPPALAMAMPVIAGATVDDVGFVVGVGFSSVSILIFYSVTELRYGVDVR